MEADYGEVSPRSTVSYSFGCSYSSVFIFKYLVSPSPSIKIMHPFNFETKISFESKPKNFIHDEKNKVQEMETHGKEPWSVEIMDPFTSWVYCQLSSCLGKVICLPINSPQRMPKNCLSCISNALILFTVKDTLHLWWSRKLLFSGNDGLSIMWTIYFSTKRFEILETN